MAKFHKLTKKLVEKLNKGEYLSVVLGLQEPEIVLTLHEITFKSNDKISDDEISGLENVLILCKSVAELNEYMTGVKYKLMPNEMYDRLLEKYKDLNGGDEPFQSFIPAGMRSTEQDFPELSGTLNKAYTVYDVSDKPSVEKWLKKCMKELEVKKLKLLIAPKFDGTSVTVTQQRQISLYDGITFTPTKAITRGDYENNLGVDLSNILVGRDTIIELGDGSIERLFPEQIGVQYEAMITEYGRKRLSEAVGIKYSTRRAAIASALKRISNPKTPKEQLELINECVSMVPLMIDMNTIQTLHRNMTFEYMMRAMQTYFRLPDSGDSLEYRFKIIEGDINSLLNEFESITRNYSDNRSGMNYSIDGLVLTIANYDHIKTLGRSSNKNKWQIAYKFDAMAQRTKVTGIISTMGKQGYIGHNITFDPIEFNGVRYDKAPVNNVTRFDRLDLHIGDEVVVSYNADVMGYIDKDAACKINIDGKKIELPERCPNCQHELVVSKDMLKCVNDDCPGHKVGRILEAIRIFNIDYFGDETAASLVEDANISDAIEFIQMKYEDLSKAMKGLNLEKAWDEFQKKIKAPISYAKVIDLLRIPGLRTKTAEKILEDLDIKELIELMENREHDKLYKRLTKIKGIDKKAVDFAEDLIKGYSDFEKLVSLLNVADTSKDKKQYDKTILISGFRTNSDFEEICKKNNLEIIDSGSKFDLLVVTPDRFEGKKAIAARKKNIPVMLLSQFISLYENGGKLVWDTEIK